MKKLTTVFVLMSFLAFSCGMLPKSVEQGGTKIQYLNGATKEDATKLLDYFESIGINDGNAKDMKISKEGDGFRIQMVLADDYDLDKKNLEAKQEFACEISKGAFDGKMITLDLCNTTWKVKKTVKSDKCDEFEFLGKEMSLYKEIELYHGDAIDKKTLDEVGEYLIGAFGGRKRITTVIDKVGDVGVFSVVVPDKQYYDDEETLDFYRIVACDLTKILGYTTEVHMCDEYVKKQKVVEASGCDK